MREAWDISIMSVSLSLQNESLSSKQTVRTFKKAPKNPRSWDTNISLVSLLRLTTVTVGVLGNPYHPLDDIRHEAPVLQHNPAI